MGEQDVEIITLNETDMSPYSERLAKECGDVAFLSQWYWLMLVDAEDKPPIFYARYFGMRAHVRTQGLIRFNQKVDRPHEFHPLHSRLKGAGEIKWQAVEGDPEGVAGDSRTYEYRIDDPEYLYRGSSRGMRAREGEILDLRLSYFPYGLKLTDRGPMTIPYIVVFGTVDGTLDNRPIRGMGGNEVLFTCSRSTMRQRQIIFIDYCGVRQDGRRECAYVMLYDHTHDGFGFYWLEGEEPILSRDVTYHGEWMKLPYAEDGILIPLQLDFRFGGKKVHYRAKWGFRQWGDPIKEAIGVGNTAGFCYEGETPYKLARCFATAEVHRVFADTVRPNDF